LALTVAGVIGFVLLDGDDPATRAATPTATASRAATPAPSPAPTPGEGAHAVATIERIGSRPTGIAVAGADVWVISPRSPFLTRIDSTTNRERSGHPKVGRDATAIIGDGDTVW